MAAILLKKVQVPTAAELCARFPLSDEAKPLLDPAAAPADFLSRLVEAKQFPDAIRLLAHALPKREAVWWACVCARETLRPEMPGEIVAALQAAEAWVYQPTEENRRGAMVRAEAARFEAGGSWAAVAAFWSGGSMAPPEAPAVPPGETLTGSAVAGAVLLSAVQHEPEKAEDKYRAFVDAAIDIANGGSGRKQQR
jgi:hypothetical protein